MTGSNGAACGGPTVPPGAWEGVYLVQPVANVAPEVRGPFARQSEIRFEELRDAPAQGFVGAGGGRELQRGLVVGELAPPNAGCRVAGVLEAGDLVGQRDVHDRRAGADHLRAQRSLALGVAVDAVVLGERLHHRGDRLAEAVADILDAARRVLDDVVQEADDLHALVVSGVTQDVGNCLSVGESLARGGPDAVIGVDQKGDRLRPAF